MLYIDDHIYIYYLIVKLIFFIIFFVNNLLKYNVMYKSIFFLKYENM